MPVLASPVPQQKQDLLASRSSASNSSGITSRARLASIGVRSQHISSVRVWLRKLSGMALGCSCPRSHPRGFLFAVARCRSCRSGLYWVQYCLPGRARTTAAAPAQSALLAPGVRPPSPLTLACLAPSARSSRGGIVFASQRVGSGSIGHSCVSGSLNVG